MSSNSGIIVKTNTGRLGRTYNSKGLVNGKVPVYIATESKIVDGVEIPIAYSETAILCHAESLEQVGFID
jgi:hypothetical protein